MPNLPASSFASMGSLTCIFLLVFTVIAFTLQHPTYQPTLTRSSNSKISRQFTVAMMVISILGFLFLTFSAFSHHPVAANRGAALKEALGV